MSTYLITLKNPVDGTKHHAIVDRGTATSPQVASMLDRLRADYPGYEVTGTDLREVNRYSVGEVLRSGPIFGKLPRIGEQF